MLILRLNEKIPEVKADTGAKVFCLFSLFHALLEQSQLVAQTGGIWNEECFKSHGAGSGKPYTDFFLLKKVRREKKKEREKANL